MTLSEHAERMSRAHHPYEMHCRRGKLMVSGWWLVRVRQELIAMAALELSLWTGYSINSAARAKIHQTTGAVVSFGVLVLVLSTKFYVDEGHLSSCPFHHPHARQPVWPAGVLGAFELEPNGQSSESMSLPFQAKSCPPLATAMRWAHLSASPVVRRTTPNVRGAVTAKSRSRPAL